MHYAAHGYILTAVQPGGRLFLPGRRARRTARQGSDPVHTSLVGLSKSTVTMIRRETTATACELPNNPRYYGTDQLSGLSSRITPSLPSPSKTHSPQTDRPRRGILARKKSIAQPDGVRWPETAGCRPARILICSPPLRSRFLTRKQARLQNPILDRFQ